MTHAKLPIPYLDKVETIPPDEAADIQTVLDALQKILVRTQAKTGQFRPDVHVKTIGYVKGEFRVVPNLPAELSQGLFEHVAMYPAVVRFSNASSQIQSDAVPDGRGMAIKLIGVEGEMALEDKQGDETQDFVMINHPVFFARNVKDYLRLEQVLVQANDGPIATLQGGLTGGDLNPLHWHWREIFTAAQIAAHIPAHPASNTYFSMAPIRFGRYVAKYRARPAADLHESCLNLIKSLALNADAMRLALEETLRLQEVVFDFQVQLRTSEQTMPVEDASVEWPESESPFRTVAQLRLPPQEIASMQRHATCKHLSFNVWHALAAHRPLGGINRVRRAVYPVSSAWRNHDAGAEPIEPQSIDEIR